MNLFVIRFEDNSQMKIMATHMRIKECCLCFYDNNNMIAAFSIFKEAYLVENLDNINIDSLFDKDDD